MTLISTTYHFAKPGPCLGLHRQSHSILPFRKASLFASADLRANSLWGWIQQSPNPGKPPPSIKLGVITKPIIKLKFSSSLNQEKWLKALLLPLPSPAFAGLTAQQLLGPCGFLATAGRSVKRRLEWHQRPRREEMIDNPIRATTVSTHTLCQSLSRARCLCAVLCFWWASTAKRAARWVHQAFHSFGQAWLWLYPNFASEWLSMFRDAPSTSQSQEFFGKLPPALGAQGGYQPGYKRLRKSWHTRDGKGAGDASFVLGGWCKPLVSYISALSGPRNIVKTSRSR